MSEELLDASVASPVHSASSAEVSTGNDERANVAELLAPQADDPTAIIRERKITILYREPEVSKKEVEIIVFNWHSGTPLMNIMRRLQAPRCSVQKAPLTYVDLYSILYTLLQTRQIVQRQTCYNELTIDDFSRFFRIWKNGGSYSECCIGITDRPTKPVLDFARLVFRSLGDRWRRENKPAVKQQPEPKINLLDHLFDLAVRRKVDGRDALVLFLSDIPIGLVQQLRRLPDGLKYDEGVQTGQDAMEALIGRATARPPVPPAPPPPPIDPDDIDLAMIDPTGAAAQAGVVQTAQMREKKAERKRLAWGKTAEDKPFPAAAPEPDKQNSAVSDEDDLETLLNEGNQSGNLTLENLADDDPIDAE